MVKPPSAASPARDALVLLAHFVVDPDQGRLKVGELTDEIPVYAFVVGELTDELPRWAN
jgi:hypothetical protein